MIDSAPGRTLASLRFAIGVSAYATPDLAGKAFGLDPAGNPQARYIGRLFAIREITLGAGLLATSREARKLWWRLGILCDAADVVSAAIAARDRSLTKVSAMLAGGTAAVATGLGVAALLAEE